MFHHTHAVAVQPLAVGGVFVIELREVGPHHPFAVVFAGGVGNPPVGFVPEPSGRVRG